MTTRYTRLYALEENLHQEGCPVLLSAGALLKDNATGAILIQLKFRNISDCIVRSVKVKINTFDLSGAKLKEIEEFSYMDLSIKRGEEFGQKTPIIVSDITARSFSVEIVSVVHSAGQYVSNGETVAKPAERDVLNAIREMYQEHEKQKKECAVRAKNLVAKYCYWTIALFALALIYEMRQIANWRRFLGMRFSWTFLKLCGNYMIIPLIIPLIAIFCIVLASKFKKAPEIGEATMILFLALQVICAIYIGIIFKSLTIGEIQAQISTGPSVRFWLIRFIMGSSAFISEKGWLVGLHNESALLDAVAGMIGLAQNITAIIIMHCCRTDAKKLQNFISYLS